MENTKLLINFKRRLLNDFINSKTMKEYLINEKKDFLFSTKEMISIIFNSDRTKKLKYSFLKEIKRSFNLNSEDLSAINRILKDEQIPSAMFITDDETGKIIKENIDYNRYPENLYVWVPIPFKIGDVVRLYNGKKKWVIVNSNLPTGDSALISDSIDSCITVVPFKFKNLITEEYLNERKIKIEKNDVISIQHEHLNIFDIELVK